MKWIHLGLTAVLATMMAEFATAEVTVRARLTAMDPEACVRIGWTWGGQGLGGDPVVGEWTEVKPGKPVGPAATAKADLEMGDKKEAGVDVLDIVKKADGPSDFPDEEGGSDGVPF